MLVLVRRGKFANPVPGQMGKELISKQILQSKKRRVCSWSHIVKTSYAILVMKTREPSNVPVLSM